MSFETLIWVRTKKVGNAAARSVLRVIADHAGQDYSCYLRTSLIADETELSDSTVRAALARLIEQGVIRVYERYDQGGRRRSNRYQLLVDGTDTPPPDAEDYADVRVAPLREPEGTHQQPEGSGGQLPEASLREPEGIPYTEATPEAPSSKGRAPRVDRATRVPENFQPTEDMRAWFAREQLGQVIDGIREHEQFMDYWRATPGVRGRKLDWPATWRRWMRDAAERAQRHGRRPGADLARVGTVGSTPFGVSGSTTDQRVSQGMALAAKYRKLEEEGKL